MSNINDYILWRGDLPINEQFEFNELDSMVLARFSYLRFDKIVMEEKETIETLSNKMEYLTEEEFRINDDKELIDNLGQSIRFRDMVVSDYIKISDVEAEKQFSAVTIHISENEMYISYIGTDNTINGWKEDFNMSFMYNVPCQVAGKEYIKKIAEKYPNKRIRIGGHSKGGNVAIYSAITADDDIQNRIIKVDNFDGPGFNKKIIEEYHNEEVIYKIESFIPQESIIGRVLEHKEKTTVTLSTERGLSQHDIYSWQVLKDKMLRSESNTQISEDINKTVTDWLETTTKEQRQVFVDSLFDILNSTNVDTLRDLKASIAVSFPKIVKGYQELDEEDRKLMSEMVRAFASSYLTVVKDRRLSIRDVLLKNKFESDFQE